MTLQSTANYKYSGSAPIISLVPPELLSAIYDVPTRTELPDHAFLRTCPSESRDWTRYTACNVKWPLIIQGYTLIGNTKLFFKILLLLQGNAGGFALANNSLKWTADRREFQRRLKYDFHGS